MGHAPTLSANFWRVRERLLARVAELQGEYDMRDVGFDARAKIGVRGMSLFDGIACPLVAAAGLGIPVEEWIVCERERDANASTAWWQHARGGLEEDPSRAAGFSPGCTWRVYGAADFVDFRPRL